MTDVIIIGAGMAGCSTALWCKRLEMQFLLVDQTSSIGGQLAHVYNPIPDYPARSAVNGAAMRQYLEEQMDAENIAPMLGVSVSDVDLAARSVTLSDGSIHQAKALVIATGVERRRLGVSGELELTGRGVGGSGRRDRENFKGQTVAVVGGGDSACENALLLAETCSKVILIHRRETFRARPAILASVKNHPRIEVMMNARVKSLVGTDWLEAARIESAHGELTVPISGLFVRIGYQPVTSLFQRQLRCDPDGYIQVDSHQRTTVTGVYAVGDVCNPIYASLAVAAGQGMIAAKSIARELALE